MEPDIELEQSMDAVVAELPAPIRQFIADGSARAIAKGIMQKYQLHIDQAGVVEREILLLLIGMRDPAQFVQELATEGGLDEKTVNAISTDVNAQIFMPLQAKMRGEESVETKPAAPAQPQAGPKPMPPANLPGVMLPKAAVTPPAPKPIAQPVFATSFAPNAAPMNAPIAPKPVVVPQVVRSTGLASALKSAGVPLLEDHEEPHIEFAKPVPPPPAPAPRVMPTTMPPVQPMPIAPVAPKPSAPIPSAPVQSAVAPQRPPAPQQPPVKAYAVDPYREQPEEHEK